MFVADKFIIAGKIWDEQANDYIGILIISKEDDDICF
jgi:hypothetical protein